MTIKHDYAQSQSLTVQVDYTDETVIVWIPSKDSDGNTYPVELQMSIKGAKDLAIRIWKAAELLEETQ